MISDRPTRVLVTGASGLIGSHIVRELEVTGYEPVALLHDTHEPGLGGERQAQGDVRDLESLLSAMRGCDAVVHAAAVYSYRRSDAALMAATNVAGTRNVLDAADRAKVRRVVVTSTAATCGPVAGRPADELDEAPHWELKVPYKATKVAAERIALQRAARGQDVVIVNPTTAIGPEDRRPTPSGKMVRDVVAGKMGGYLTASGLNVVAAQDIARGHVLALERGRAGERYLLGGENWGLRALFELIAETAGVAPPRIGLPYGMVLGAAWIVDAANRFVGREPTLLVLDEVRLARLPMFFNSAKAEAELGYSYRPAADAVAEAVTWFRRSLSAAGDRAGQPTARGAWRRRVLLR